MRILLCTGGSPHGQNALLLGASLAQRSPTAATLLGVVERPGDRALVVRALEEGREWLASAPEPRILTREGHASEEILAEAARERYDLVVVGTRGRRGITRILLGSTAERIVRHATVPVLLVQGERDSVERVLISTAAGGPALASVEYGGHVAQLAGAHVTVLHVMSQVLATPVLPHAGALQVMPQTPAPPDEPGSRFADLKASAEQLMKDGTPEGMHLQEALGTLAELSVPAEARVRHGLVVDEILAEIYEGDHDMVVVGSRPARGWTRFLLDDLSQQIIDCTDRPVLVVRF
jgi:nucleotide-binding universal stress UspA family protein